MTEKAHDVRASKTHDIKHVDKKHTSFQKNITKLNALASIFKDSADIIVTERESRNGLKALNAEGGLQEMLAAQMLSIHQLQQQAISFANKSKHIENIRYYTNTAIKLANCFTQQANTLSRLQGHIGHKITVEHVDVHHGGQAIVGNVCGHTPADKVKK